MAGGLRAAGAATGIAASMVVAMAISGCSWRLETPPPSFPTAGAFTLTRDAAAQREQRVIDAIDEETAGTGNGSRGRAALIDIESRSAPASLVLLGGLYVAYPSEEPSPNAGRAADLREAVIEARNGALHDALESDDPDFAFLSGSIGLTHAFAAWWAAVEDARVGGADIDRVELRRLPAPFSAQADGIVPDASSLNEDLLVSLALEHDEARFTYEVIAAREYGPRRQEALDRAAIHRRRAEALVALAGSDPRTPIYELPSARVATDTDRLTTARELESSLGWKYAQATSGAPASERSWLLDSAFDAYTAAAMVDGFDGAQFPVLPGVDRASLP